MADIFLSYASDDRTRVVPLVEAIEARGWSVWWDREIHAGPRFDQVIEEEIAEATCVVVIWSEASVKSDWVRDEANEGRERQILVPLLFDDVRPPLGFRAAHTANLIGWPVGIVIHISTKKLQGRAQQRFWTEKPGTSVPGGDRK